jgi:hypothetical protein
MVAHLLHYLIGSCVVVANGLAAPAESSKKSPRELAGLAIAEHVIPVRRINAKKEVTPVGAPFRQLRTAADDFGPDAVGTGYAKAVAHQVEYITEVGFGDKNFSLIIDTGSSDTWVARSTFVCLERGRNSPLPLKDCAFGPLYNGDFPGGQIANQTFNITYGSATGPWLGGVMGYAP